MNEFFIILYACIKIKRILLCHFFFFSNDLSQYAAYCCVDSHCVENRNTHTNTFISCPVRRLKYHRTELTAVHWKPLTLKLLHLCDKKIQHFPFRIPQWKNTKNVANSLEFRIINEQIQLIVVQQCWVNMTILSNKFSKSGIFIYF